MMKMRGSRLLWLWLVFVSIGRLAVAESGSAESLLERGDGALSAGAYQQAIDFYQDGIRALDDAKDPSLAIELSLHINLATSYSMLEDSERAIDAYQNALKIHKRKIKEISSSNESSSTRQESNELAAHASSFLGMLYQDLQEPRNAIDAYQYAFDLDPTHWASMANLASVWQDELSNYRQALHAYQVAYEILTDPSIQATDEPAEPRFILSQLQYRIGLCISHSTDDNKCAMDTNPDEEVDCNQLAAHAFAKAIEFDDTNDSARHMLASVTADATVKRASNTYVKSLFDEYAGNFEHSLVKELGYTGYERLRKGFDRAMAATTSATTAPTTSTTRTFDMVLDAGCGTGLVGQEFRNISTRLIGVDLSQAILDQAMELRPHLYDETVEGDVTEILQSAKYAGRLDLIIAADSFIYFGDLNPLFAAINVGLQGQAYVAFTLENVSLENEQALQAKESKSPDWRWQLQPSGRFAHRQSYVETCATQHGLDLVHYEALDGFRYEQGLAVRGHLFVLQKVKQDASADEL